MLLVIDNVLVTVFHLSFYHEFSFSLGVSEAKKCYSTRMDLEQITHRSHNTAVVLALVLSAMITVVMSFLVHASVNLKGSLLLDEPTDVTVISAVEPKLQDGIVIKRLTFLRKEDNPVLSKVKPVYSYIVALSDTSMYLTQLVWSADEKRWMLEKFEKLH